MSALDDEELACAAFMLRIRAANGDREALREAERLGRILKTRRGPTPSSHAPPEGTQAAREPWWRFW